MARQPCTVVRSIACLTSGLFLAWALFSCTHDKALDIAPGKPRKLETSPAASPPALVQFALDAGSVATFTLGAGAHKVTGSVPVVQSTLAIDFADLSRSTAHLTFSLQELSLEPASKPTPHFPNEAISTARAWVQQSPPFAGQFYPEAEFVLERVGSRKSRFLPSPRRLPTTDASSQTRRIHAFATGSLALHGVRRLYTVPLTATFHYTQGETIAGSALFESRGQATLDLKAHRMAAWPPPSAAVTRRRPTPAPLVGISFRWSAHRIAPTPP